MNDDFNELTQASSTAELYERLATRVASAVRPSGVHIMPLVHGAGPTPGSVVRLRDKDPGEFVGKLGRAVTELLAQPALPVLFEQPDCVMRVEQAFGWDRWLRMPVYQEHFRPTDSARQLVFGLRSALGVPRAFMAVCRSETDENLTEGEEGLLSRLRDAAEKALCAFDLHSDWSEPAEDILAAISSALPVPALLLDADGRVLWMNREAELRLDSVGVPFGSKRYYGRGSRALEELVSYVRFEARGSRTSGGAQRAAVAFEWLLPGETVIVRRIEQSGAPVRVLVCLSTRPALPLRTLAHDALTRAHRLSAREADVVLLATEGFSVLNIASSLNIAESTVASHLKRVYKKLGVRSRAELAWRIMRR